MNPLQLTGCQWTSVEIPFDDHAGIADRFNARLHVHACALSLLHILQGDDELRWWIHAILLSRSQMGLGAFHMTQIDNFRTRNWPTNDKELIKRNSHFI